MRLCSGIIGQSFDGSKIAVSGRLDQYGPATGESGLPSEFTTYSQAEGAIEGVHTDYKLPSPFATAFKYERFDVDKTKPIAPRSVQTLTGSKKTARAEAQAGVAELPGVGVEDDSTGRA